MTKHTPSIRLKTYIRPKPRGGQPSRGLKVPDIAPHERDASAFWFRRIATAATLGNGAGVIALASFLGGSENIELSAPIAFPSLGLFLTGALCGFGSFILSLLWAVLRMDAHGEYFEKLSALAVKITDPTIRTTQTVFIFFAVILTLFQFALFILAGLCFYAASSHIVSAIGIAACKSQPASDYCSFSLSPLFPAPGNGAGVGVAANAGPKRYSVSAKFSTHPRQSAEPIPWISRVTIANSDVMGNIHMSSVDQIFRLTHYISFNDKRECLISIAHYSNDSYPPYNRNPQLGKFIQKSTRMGPGFQIEPSRLNLTVFYESGGGKGVDDLWFDPGEGVLRPVSAPTRRLETLIAIPGETYAGGLLIYSPPTAEPNGPCIQAARAAGFSISITETRQR